MAAVIKTALLVEGPTPGSVGQNTEPRNGPGGFASGWKKLDHLRVIHWWKQSDITTLQNAWHFLKTSIQLPEIALMSIYSKELKIYAHIQVYSTLVNS